MCIRDRLSGSVEFTLRYTTKTVFSDNASTNELLGEYVKTFQQISVMNASVGLLIVDGEKNVSVSWTGDYPPILLTDELRLDDTGGKCNNFGRIASKGKS